MKALLGDIEVSYTAHGEGMPVVFVHGLAEGRESWCEIQKRIGNFRTYAYDLRGHGETALGIGKGTIEQLGNDLVTFLEKVCGQAQCVGYSLGGTLVLWAAAKRPELVSAAIVAGTSAVVGRQAVGFFLERIRMIEENFSAFAPVLKKDTASQIVTSGVDVEALTARRLEAVGNGGGYVNAARAMIGLHKNPLTPLLSNIQCPVSVIGGSGDIFCPRKAADIMLNKLSNGTYQEVNDAGHLMSVDQLENYSNTIHKSLQRRN